MTRRSFFRSCLAACGAMLLPVAVLCRTPVEMPKVVQPEAEWTDLGNGWKKRVSVEPPNIPCFEYRSKDSPVAEGGPVTVYTCMVQLWPAAAPP